jgi:SPOR domain
MNLYSGDEPMEPIDDLRQLIAQSKNSRNESGESRTRRLLAYIRVSSALDLLESSGASLLTVCICLALAGVSLFLFQKYYAHTDVSADATDSSQWQSVQPTSSEEASDTTVNNQLPDLIQYGPAGSTESFIIRVGAFRNSENARRVAESLQHKGVEVQVAVRADGINLVTVGPFSRKGAAEDAAREVKESLGLVPMVLRRDPQ